MVLSGSGNGRDADGVAADSGFRICILKSVCTQPTWSYDEALKTWVYMEGAGRPYGSLYMAEWTPDGYYVNADGVWEPAR